MRQLRRRTTEGSVGRRLVRLDPELPQVFPFLSLQHLPQFRILRPGEVGIGEGVGLQRSSIGGRGERVLERVMHDGNHPQIHAPGPRNAQRAADLLNGRAGQRPGSVEGAEQVRANGAQVDVRRSGDPG